MTDHSTYATITRVYTGRTVCIGCSRTISGKEVAYDVSGTNLAGTYCRRCAGPLLLDLIASDAGLDAPVALAKPERVARDEQVLVSGTELHWAIGYATSEPVHLEPLRALALKLGMSLR